MPWAVGDPAKCGNLYKHLMMKLAGSQQTVGRRDITQLTMPLACTVMHI